MDADDGCEWMSTCPKSDPLPGIKELNKQQCIIHLENHWKKKRKNIRTIIESTHYDLELQNMFDRE